MASWLAAAMLGEFLVATFTSPGFSRHLGIQFIIPMGPIVWGPYPLIN